MKELKRLFFWIVCITVGELRMLIYLSLVWTGFLTAIRHQIPWLLLITLHLAPVVRFGSLKSLSLGLFDFTFHTEDGGLHGAMGTAFYAITTPVYIVGAYTGQFINNEDQETANAVNDE